MASLWRSSFTPRVLALLLFAPEYLAQYLPAAGRAAAAAGAAAAARTSRDSCSCSRASTCRRSRKPDRVEMSDVDRSARSPEKTPSLTNPLPSARGNSTRAHRIDTRREDARPGARAATRAAGAARRNAVGRRSAQRRHGDDAEAAGAAAAGRLARRSVEEPAEVRAERVVQQPEGTGAGIRAAAVRHQGRRVRSVDPPLRLAGAPQLVRADGGDDACAAAS